LAALFDARLQTVPAGVVAWALRGAWGAHLAPAHPYLFDALMRLPVMSNERAKRELGWRPKVSARDAVADVLRGMRTGEGHPTPPLDRDAGGSLRRHEIASGVGASER
jgi:hypothetical protein